tara:strand:- start:457 stop:777 length:321 start_codon:yes stop_codon:yes gene_type:complete
MPIKIREIKDDALITITLNKNFYLMLKSVMLYIFKQEPDQEKYEGLIKKVMSSEHENELHTEHEAAFKTMLILLAEIERMAGEQDSFNIREIPTEGDEGYVPPSAS